MRWNCPHCGVNLAVSDDKLGAGWSFSRCYKCGGFALIRRAEVNLVKVDRAPAGENIILPEATEEPLSALSEGALQNLSQIRKDSAARAQPPAPPLPNPIPERVARSSWLQKILPAAISLTAVTTVGSGIYLYLQGQALWEKTRVAQAPVEASAPSAPVHVAVAAFSARDVVPAPALAAKALRDEGSDQLHQKAMAPLRDETAVQKESGSSVLIVQARGKNADIHTGPGSLYPLVGMADPKQKLHVTDWSDRWFKIVLPSQKFGWIRTDLVQVIPDYN